MALAKYNKDAMFPSVSSFFNDFFRNDLMDWGLSNFAGTDSTLPAVNVSEDDKAYNIEVAAPGMNRDDFKVDYDNGRLTISSEKQEENKDEKDGKVTRREFNYQSFQRVFNVSENEVKADDISAKYMDGILKVNIPKKEEARKKKAKTIKIS
ncbi:MAG: Hsp20/alpha crystallin family protein [Bacteroidota bacterium]